MTASQNIPTDIPEDLHHLASRLSWEDAVNLLCLYERWANRKDNTPESRAKLFALMDDMRVLVRALPYEWSPPPVVEHSLVTALAVYVRTGKMPPAPPGYGQPFK